MSWFIRRISSKMLPTARDGTGINIDDDELADAVTTLAGTSGPPAGFARESGAAAALSQFAGPSSPPAASPSADRSDRRRADDLASGERRWNPQLGLPLRLDSGREPHDGGSVVRRMP